jgi:hypothetical protein
LIYDPSVLMINLGSDAEEDLPAALDSGRRGGKKRKKKGEGKFEINMTPE